MRNPRVAGVSSGLYCLLSIVLLLGLCCKSSAAGGMGCIPVPPGIVSWWKGESNALDSADSNVGALQNGVAFGSGMVGQAFSFDGVNDLVRVPDATNLRVTNLTIETWVNPVAFQSPFDEIVSKWDSTSGTNRAYTFKCDPAGRVI